MVKLRLMRASQSRPLENEVSSEFSLEHFFVPLVHNVLKTG